MNIYGSMNNYFNKKLAAIEKSTKLAESVEKPVVEFEEMTIPAPFDTYYRIIRPEEYEDILGFEYDADEIKSEAGEYGIEKLQYAILKDGFDTDGEVEVVAICADEDNTFVGINVGGNMYPIDFDEVKAQIKEVKLPIKESVSEVWIADTFDWSLDAPSKEEALKKAAPQLEDLFEDIKDENGYSYYNYPQCMVCIYRENDPEGVGEVYIKKDGEMVLVGSLRGRDVIDAVNTKKYLRTHAADRKERDRREKAGELIKVDYDDPKYWEFKAARIAKNPINEALNPWEKLVKAYPELADDPVKESPIKEAVEDDDSDLWDKVYGELTMDGELAPSSTGKSYKFNTGAGYRYADQVWTGRDGEICVGAESMEELEAAARVALSHKKDGVTYKLCKGSPNRDKFPFIIEIYVPYVEE